LKRSCASHELLARVGDHRSENDFSDSTLDQLGGKKGTKKTKGSEIPGFFRPTALRTRERPRDESGHANPKNALKVEEFPPRTKKKIPYSKPQQE